MTETLEIKTMASFQKLQQIANENKNIPPSYIKMRYLTCECGKLFFSETDLYSHFNETGHKIIARDISTYQCNICTKVLDTESYFLQHHVIIHQSNPTDLRRLVISGPAKNQISCNICDKVLKSHIGLKLHMSIHTGDKPFKCDLCDEAFSEKSELEIHIKAHPSKRPFACTFCSFAFTRSDNLKRHMVLHLGKKYQCTICLKSFINNNFLRKHYTAVHVKGRTKKKKRRPPKL